MTLKNTYNQITLAVIAILAMPVLAMAFTGTPTITLNGVSDVGETYATAMVTYNSNDAVYTNSEEPVTYVEYMNVVTGELLVTPFGYESYGNRSHSFGIFDLEKDTQYMYRGVMKYAGQVVKTNAQTFTTTGKKPIPKPTPDPKTPGTIPVDPLIIKDTTTKIVEKAKSKIMTAGATHKNGVAISISDEQARTSVGDVMTFTIQYENINKESLKNAELVIELPEQYEFVKSSSDMDYNEHDNTVTYIAGRVAAGTIKTVTFTARAIGDGSSEVRTTATLFYEGGTISASDRDSYHGGSKSVLGASVFGAGFFPQTLWGWLAIIILIAVIIIVARRYVVTHPAK